MECITGGKPDDVCQFDSHNKNNYVRACLSDKIM